MQKKNNNAKNYQKLSKRLRNTTITNTSLLLPERNCKQAGAEFGQAQQLVFQIWGWFGFCCQRPAKSQIWFCQELIVEA